MPLWLLVPCLLGGCGSVVVMDKLNAVSLTLEQVRRAGAESRATYEYYCAAEHLKKARQEVTEGDYGDALALAQTAMDCADRASMLLVRDRQAVTE